MGEWIKKMLCIYVYGIYTPHTKSVYKINTQKSVAFLYTKNEATVKEIKESIPFAVAQKP